MRNGSTVAFSTVALLVLTACSTAPEQAPGAGPELASDCMAERVRVIHREWLMYESVSLERIVFPDWRAHARRWAQVECEQGRVVAAFHPVTSATARRHY